MEAISINPEFNDLNKPETILKHIQDITKNTEPTPHTEILNQLVGQFEPLDFEEELLALEGNFIANRSTEEEGFLRLWTGSVKLGAFGLVASRAAFLFNCKFLLLSLSCFALCIIFSASLKT